MINALDLSGTWQLRWSDGQRQLLAHAERPDPADGRWIDARVPGEVHLDLMRAGVIADPFVGANILASRWVEECWWSYRRTFSIGDVPAGRAWLVFEGLDLAATVFLNGVEVGRHANVFYPCRIDVTGKLRAGENLVLVHLDPGLWSVADKPANDWTHWPDQLLNKRHWLRKPQCQFGWDWAPRLINCGIFKPVRLEWTDAPAPARAEQFVATATVSDDLSRGAVRGRWFVEHLASPPAAVKLTVELPELSLRATSEGTGAMVEATLDVPGPELWWPVGQGAQRLYTVRATLEADGKVIAQAEKQVGFRHVRINQDPHPQGGRHFNLEINGRKIFARGSNWVPADLIFARIDRPRYEALIDLALEQNFNFLRVWGGGLYESDDFYDLCNRRGILVWQEFIFACSRYPTHDQAFFEDAKREATYNLRRLASHPSLIVWCGNNEIEWGDWDWDYGHKGAIMPDHGFFHVTLPRLVAQEDGTRPYQPSSPYSPDHQHPNHDLLGDQHPWSVGFFSTDALKYREMRCRFPTEGGIIGPTSLPTIRKCLGGAQNGDGSSDGKVLSFPWTLHDNSVVTWTQPPVYDGWVARAAGVSDVRELSLEDFVYWAGLLQGEALKEYVENFRRRMFDSGAAIFWMFNDCWPATRSWTTVDYDLRRTPAFHPVRRAMAPLHVTIVRDGADGDHVSVFGINDTPEPVEAELRFGLFRVAGGMEMDQRQRVTLPANASARLASWPMAQWREPRETGAFAQIDDAAGTLVARNRLFLHPVHELELPPADVRVMVRGGLATFESATFAWGVCLHLDGDRRLADNFFDLLPGVPHVVPWPDESAPQVRVGGRVVASAPGPSA